jgi:hypothetical protein
MSICHRPARVANLPDIMGIFSASALTIVSARSVVPAHLGHPNLGHTHRGHGHPQAHHGVHISPVGAGSR